MARRRRARNDLEFAEAIFGLIALLFFLSLFSPAVRETIRVVGFGFLILTGSIVVGGLGFLIYRFIAKRRKLQEEAVPLRVFDLSRMEPEVIVSPQPPTPPSVTLKGW